MNGKALLLSLVLLPLAALAQTPVIQISGANFRPVPLALPAPLVQGEAAKSSQAVDEALQFDLRACGLFQVLDRESFLADPKEGVAAGSINFARWADVGAESLVKYSVAQDGSELRAELRVFNVGSGREDFKTAQSAPAAQPSLLAHKIADAIYRNYTHEPSPFLSRIAYVRKSGGNKDVWTSDWDGRNAKQLTKGGINVLPALGPEGLVGFTSYQQGKPDIYIQRPGADTVRLKTPEGEMATGIAFSPDGKRIAYALADGESAQIWVAGTDGENAKQITDTRFGINTSPAWSPDGKRLAFVSNRGGSPQVYVMGVDGSAVRRLTFQGNYNQTPELVSPGRSHRLHRPRRAQRVRSLHGERGHREGHPPHPGPGQQRGALLLAQREARPLHLHAQRRLPPLRDEGGRQQPGRPPRAGQGRPHHARLGPLNPPAVPGRMMGIMSPPLLSPALRSTFPSDREADTFQLRLRHSWDDLERGLRTVYPDPSALLPRLLDVMVRAHHDRAQDLRRLDEARVLAPDWLQQPRMLGYVCYVDRFAGTLRGVEERVPYLEELGVKYLHLMPLLKPREGENDGGYAVRDYRAVREDLGHMRDLEALARRLRTSGISLCLDLVLNHVAEDHDWARRARAGDPRYERYFHLFPDREQPDAFERTLPEVFPDFAPGNFTWDEACQRWVWTTFNRYQWDLNWASPDVFLEFADLLLYLANQGVEVFRLDAIAFIWKRLGTDCQNQPEVHFLTQALRAVLRVVAPAVAFKAEAIVAPADLMAYLGRGEHAGRVSDMAYHNSLMVQIWSSLASQDTRLFEVALRAFPDKPPTTTWGAYLRCHDDIGWAISDADAQLAGVTGKAHRHFLSDYYSGQFAGSPARGLVFQFNPRTGDRRISGSAASLAGLETALASEDPHAIGLAIDRVLLGHAVVMGFGGVPLLYMGDELATLNDTGYAEDPAHALDNRWVHRPRMDWARAEQARLYPDSVPGRVYAGLRALIHARQLAPQLHAFVESRVVPSPNPHVLILERPHALGTLVAVYNFSVREQELPSRLLRERGLSAPVDRIRGQDVSIGQDTVRLEPLARLWLTTPRA